jgi:hypothetical protein
MGSVTLPGLSEVALKVGAKTGVEAGTCIAACTQFLVRNTNNLSLVTQICAFRGMQYLLRVTSVFESRELRFVVVLQGNAATQSDKHQNRNFFSSSLRQRF